MFCPWICWLGLPGIHHVLRGSRWGASGLCRAVARTEQAGTEDEVRCGGMKRTWWVKAIKAENPCGSAVQWACCPHCWTGLKGEPSGAWCCPSDLWTREDFTARQSSWIWRGTGWPNILVFMRLPLCIHQGPTSESHPSFLFHDEYKDVRTWPKVSKDRSLRSSWWTWNENERLHDLQIVCDMCGSECSLKL